MVAGHDGCAVAAHIALLPDAGIDFGDCGTRQTVLSHLGTTSNLLPANLASLAMHKKRNVLGDRESTDLSSPMRQWHLSCRRTPLGCSLMCNVSRCWRTMGFGHTSRYLKQQQKA